ncbi:MAG TPA: hypothetical protein VFS97_03780 [Nitrososphaeraceae archaeon]|nr:hypothetical protein [Nitrososphaeraceae archaeon]
MFSEIDHTQEVKYTAFNPGTGLTRQKSFKRVEELTQEQPNLMPNWLAHGKLTWAGV